MAIISQKSRDYIADNLEAYLDAMDTFIVVTNIDKEEYDEAVHKIRKLIKKLRDKKLSDEKLEKIFNFETLSRYRDMIEKEADDHEKKSISSNSVYGYS